jgi:ubiquinone/menaquinone biosynthesis C-methylase UbiE
MSEEIRDMVKQAYGKAVQSQGGCCAQSAGYGAELDQGVQSFGCGNPLAFAEVAPGQTVLDLGSGPGLDLLIAAKAVGPTGRVIGVDMTDEMLAKARENTRAHESIELRKGIIEKLPVEDASVDWVISNCVINLSPEKERVFAEIARVLKPGGRFSITDICVTDLPVWVREHELAYASCIAGAIDEREYAAGLRAAGLEATVAGRMVYEPEQIRGLVESDLAAFELDAAALEGRYEELRERIASVRFTGRRP